jgi:hypothetical protein
MKLSSSLNFQKVLRVPVLASLAALPLVAGCSGSTPTSPTSTTSSSGTSTGTSGTGVTTYTYTNDIRPILASDCTRCHNASQHEAGYDFTTYAGVLRALTPGNPQSILVQATSSRGVMYQELSGNRAAKAQIFYDWVVSSNAAQ